MDGTTREFLEDGDEVIITGYSQVNVFIIFLTHKLQSFLRNLCLAPFSYFIMVFFFSFLFFFGPSPESHVGIYVRTDDGLKLGLICRVTATKLGSGHAQARFFLQFLEEKWWPPVFRIKVLSFNHEHCNA